MTDEKPQVKLFLSDIFQEFPPSAIKKMTLLNLLYPEDQGIRETNHPGAMSGLTTGGLTGQMTGRETGLTIQPTFDLRTVLIPRNYGN